MSTFYLGLDLGQMSDYTALTVLQEVETAKGEPPVYHLRLAERMPLGTPYATVASRVKAVQRSAPLVGAMTNVIADVTGVGLPVLEMLVDAEVQNLRGVVIHGGDQTSCEGRIHRVPKRDLVSNLQVLLQGGRLRFAERLDHADILRHELQSFRAKINVATGHDSYEAWREGDHDDLVLSLALAAWYAEQIPEVWLIT